MLTGSKEATSLPWPSPTDRLSADFPLSTNVRHFVLGPPGKVDTHVFRDFLVVFVPSFTLVLSIDDPGYEFDKKLRSQLLLKAPHGPELTDTFLSWEQP